MQRRKGGVAAVLRLRGSVVYSEEGGRGDSEQRSSAA